MGNSSSSARKSSKRNSMQTISKPSAVSRRVSDPSHRQRHHSSRVGNGMVVNRSRSDNQPQTTAEPPPPYTPTMPEPVANSPVDINMPVSLSMPSSPVVDTSSAGSRHTTIVHPPNGSSSRAPRSNTYLRTPMRQQSKEDALETLKKYNTVFVVDDSASMQGALWHEATQTLSTLADLAGQYDADGIDIHFLNDETIGLNMKNSQDVNKLFKTVYPRGITPIGGKLEELLHPYLYEIEKAQASGGPAALKKIKPINFIIITDGAPTDDPEPVIVQAAKRLDAKNFPITQLGIQFVQIGNSRSAMEYLNKLDNDLTEKHKIRDIVDTTPYLGQLNADVLIKILLGGINRRVDVRGAGSVS